MFLGSGFCLRLPPVHTLRWIPCLWLVVGSTKPPQWTFTTKFYAMRGTRTKKDPRYNLESFSVFVLINVLRTPKPYKIRVFKLICRLLVALPEHLKSTLNIYKCYEQCQILIEITFIHYRYIIENCCFFKIESIFIADLYLSNHIFYKITNIYEHNEGLR